jgi:hypothetical protein
MSLRPSISRLPGDKRISPSQAQSIKQKVKYPNLTLNTVKGELSRGGIKALRALPSSSLGCSSSSSWEWQDLGDVGSQIMG